MGEAAKVQGEKLSELFDELIEKKVIISMNVVGTGFDRLTCVTAIVRGSAGSHLIVDPPNDFKEAVSTTEEWRLRFNYVGGDRLEYIFHTRGGSVDRQGLKIPFPDHVERLQRRRNFRVNTMTGTRLSFKLKKIQGVIDLINISRGGAYGVLIKTNFKFMRGSVLKVDQQVYHIDLEFPADDGAAGQRVHIERAEIKRVERDPERGFYRYGFEFKDVEKAELDRLTRIIYDLQRKYLRHRK